VKFKIHEKADKSNGALVEHIGERKSREKDALLILKLLLLL
jgi:hypothetical protein